MLDIVKLKLQAGNGGNGRVSFRREKYIPKGGPNGGNGGDGGNVIIRGNAKLNTLTSFAGKKELSAANGGAGRKKKQAGEAGEDLVVEVPLGTIIWELAKKGDSLSVLPQKFYLERENQLVSPRPQPEWTNKEALNNFSTKNLNLKNLSKHKLAEISKEKQEYIICHGGKGGRGNDAFKSAGNRVPLEAEYGGLGEEKIVVFELKVLADLGLVGFPSVGKSTFLKRVTRANPKIAAYHFTTLSPNLGIWKLNNDQELVVADIPGLIEGASEGKGLGHEFLRHIERCQQLLFVLALDEAEVFDKNLSLKQKAQSLITQLKLLKQELSQHEPKLLEKKYLLVINKLDLLTPELKAAITKEFKINHLPQPHFISTATGEGISSLQPELFLQ